MTTVSALETMALGKLAEKIGVEAWGKPYTWWLDTVLRLGRDLVAAADTGHELPEETLKAAKDFLGVLVGG